MSTRTFLHWIEQAFGVVEAATAWISIRAAVADKVPADFAEDPVLIRTK